MAAGIATVVLASTLALAGCGEPESGSGSDGEPAAVGAVRSVDLGVDSVAIGFDPDPGFEYFEGTTFNITPETPGVDAATLEVGDRIEVWTELCAESFPVQCDVTRVERAEP